MNNDIMRIKCPHDGSILTVRRTSDIESRSVTCPVCKTKMRFTDFIIVDDGASDETQYGGSPATHGTESLALGILTVKCAEGTSYRLQPGINIIGRRSANSKATIQIDCPGRRTSREHLVIEVKQRLGEGYVHCARLYKSDVNATFINGLKLEGDDEFVLSHGNIINLPDVELLFSVP